MPTAKGSAPKLPEPLLRIVEARHHDPFEVLGRHVSENRATVRAFLPQAERAILVEAQAALHRIEGTDLFVWEGDASQAPERYRIAWEDAAGVTHQDYDPYCFPAQLADFDLHLFGEGRHWHAYRFLGSHVREVEGVSGVQFAVWAPNADRVSVVGDFNGWDGRAHPMRVRGGTGVWELFVPGLATGGYYKYEIRDHASHIHHVAVSPQAPDASDGPFANANGERRGIERRGRGDAAVELSLGDPSGWGVGGAHGG